MCLIGVAYNVAENAPLIVTANRDEFYERHTAPARFWMESPEIAAGKDMVRGGTWMGVTRAGRFAAVTNYRDPNDQTPNLISRGELVINFLEGSISSKNYAEVLLSKGSQTRGYNMLLFDGAALVWMSNRTSEFKELTPGIYGLSNALLDTPWPKVQRTKERLTELVRGNNISLYTLLEIMQDRSKPHDTELPNTGVGIEWERHLSSPFICAPGYGTRSSSALIIRQDHWHFAERSFHANGELKGEVLLNSL